MFAGGMVQSVKTTSSLHSSHGQGQIAKKLKSSDTTAYPKAYNKTALGFRLYLSLEFPHPSFEKGNRHLSMHQRQPPKILLIIIPLPHYHPPSSNIPFLPTHLTNACCVAVSPRTPSKVKLRGGSDFTTTEAPSATTTWVDVEKCG